MSEDKEPQSAEKMFSDACKIVAKKHGLGDKLVTGHRYTYFEEAAMLYCHNVCKNRVKEVMTVLESLHSEAYDLMYFCVDRGHIDQEDETDGVIAFNASMAMASHILTMDNPKIEK